MAEEATTGAHPVKGKSNGGRIVNLVLPPAAVSAAVALMIPLFTGRNAAAEAQGIATRVGAVEVQCTDLARDGQQRERRLILVEARAQQTSEALAEAKAQQARELAEIKALIREVRDELRGDRAARTRTGP